MRSSEQLHLMVQIAPVFFQNHPAVLSFGLLLLDLHFVTVFFMHHGMGEHLV